MALVGRKCPSGLRPKSESPSPPRPPSPPQALPTMARAFPHRPCQMMQIFQWGPIIGALSGAALASPRALGSLISVRGVCACVCACRCAVGVIAPARDCQAGKARALFDLDESSGKSPVVVVVGGRLSTSAAPRQRSAAAGAARSTLRLHCLTLLTARPADVTAGTPHAPARPPFCFQVPERRPVDGARTQAAKALHTTRKVRPTERGQTFLNRRSGARGVSWGGRRSSSRSATTSARLLPRRPPK